MLQAGAAKVDITPRSPVYLGGYGIGPTRKCSQISSSIYARALVLRSGSRAVAFLVLDTQGLGYESRWEWFGHRALEERAREVVPGLELVFGASSHSHCSPDSTGLWGGLEEGHARQLVEGAVAAIADAATHTVPCSAYFGAAHTDGLLRSIVRTKPHDRVEDRAFALELRSPDEQPVGRLVVFSAHATVASGNHLSSDWPGVLAASLEENPGGITLVVPGCIGRTQPLRFTRGDQRAVEEYARRVEAQVRPLLSDLQPLPSPTEQSPEGARAETSRPEDFLGAVAKTVELPIANLAIAVAARALGRPRSPSRGLFGLPASRTVLKVARVGNVYFFGFPGEAYPNLGWALEECVASTSKGARAVTCSLVGDQIGYLIFPPSSYPSIALRSAWNDNALLCASPTASARLLDESLGLAQACSPAAAPPDRAELQAPHRMWEAAGVAFSAAAVVLAAAGAGAYLGASLLQRVGRPALRNRLVW